jgi:hypothetical protein
MQSLAIPPNKYHSQYKEIRRLQIGKDYTITLMNHLPSKKKVYTLNKKINSS